MNKKSAAARRTRPEWRERIDELVRNAPPMTEWQIEVLRRLMVPAETPLFPRKDDRAA